MITTQLKYIFLLFFFLLISFLTVNIWASEKAPDEKNGNDVINHKNNSLQDSVVLHAKQDTLKMLIDGGDSLEIPLEESSLKDDILDMLYGSIFRDTTKRNFEPESNLTESEEKYLIYKDKIIVNIYLKKVPVFGGSVEDSLEFTVSKIERFGNSVHVNTKDWVIYNNLFFDEGDRLEPYELADNERILRQLPFIRDARILVIPRTEDEKVDILVVTRDVFSLGLSINVRDVDDIAVSIFERNLFGNGWQFRNTFRYRSKFDQKIDYEGIFDIFNISGSFVGMTLQYVYAHDLQHGFLRFYRDYLTPETKYAGGVDFSRIALKNEADNFQSLTYVQNSYDFWLGRSFLLGGVESRRTLKIGARYYRRTYDERPLVLADSNFAYHNQKLYLANIILDKREYFTSRMIYGFGITEDIPTGYVYELTGGFSEEEFKNRPYVGLDVRFASWYDDIGYMVFRTQAATYINRNKSEDGLINLYCQYFSPLMDLGNYRFRHFFYANYFTGINRIDDRFIDIREDDGIRGLSNDSMDGVERLVIRLESVAFTPWNFIGFQFSTYTFADLGWISSDKGLLSNQQFSSAVGLGCRIRNEGLVFQTINLRFAYFPSVPTGESHFGFDISTNDPRLFHGFSSGKPRLIPFE